MKGIYDQISDLVDVSSRVFQLSPQVEFSRIEDNALGEAAYIIKSAGNSYLKIGQEEKFLLEQMKDPICLGDLSVLYFMEYSKLGGSYLESFVDTLQRKDFLSTRHYDFYQCLRDKLMAERSRGNGSFTGFMKKKILYISGLDGAFTFLYARGGKWLCLKSTNLIFILMTLLSLLLLPRAIDWHGVSMFQHRQSVVLGLLTLLFIKTIYTFIHECAHGLSVKHFGRRVERGGIISHLGVPSFFVDTNDIWMRPKWERIIVSLAGPYSTLVINSFLIFFLYQDPHGPWAPLAGKMVLWGLFSVVVNLNPILSFDGYYVLIDLLQFPLLRERALSHLRETVMALAKGKMNFHPTSEALYLSLYSLFSLLWMVGSIIFVLLVLSQRIMGLAREFLASGSSWPTRSLIFLCAAIFILPLLVSLAAFLRQGLLAALTHFRDSVWRKRPWVKELIVWPALLVLLGVLPDFRGDLKQHLPTYLLWTVPVLCSFIKNSLTWMKELYHRPGIRPLFRGVNIYLYLYPLLLCLSAKAAMFVPCLLPFLLVPLHVRRTWGSHLGHLGLFLLGGVFTQLLLLSSGRTSLYPILVWHFYHGALYLHFIKADLGRWNFPRAEPAKNAEVEETLAVVTGSSDVEKIKQSYSFLLEVILQLVEVNLGRHAKGSMLDLLGQSPSAMSYREDKSGRGIVSFASSFPLELRAAGKKLAREWKRLTEILSLYAGGRAASLAPRALEGLYWANREIFTEHVLQESGGEDHLHIPTMNEEANFLREVGPFKEFSLDELRFVTERMKWERFGRQEKVIAEGEAGDKFYIVHQGTLRVVKKGTVTAILTRGDIFGERTLYLNMPRSADVVGDEEGVLITMRKADFDHLLKDRPNFRKRIEEYIDSSFKFLDFLRSIPLFSRIAERDLRALGKEIKFLELAPHQLVFREGDEGEGFYIIKEGQVEIFCGGGSGERVVSRMGKGEYFGEIGLFRSIKRTASVRALTTTVLFVVAREDFKRIFANDSMVDKISSRRARERDCRR